MNPVDWEGAIRTLQRHLDPNHQGGVDSSVETASRTHNDWDPYCQYSTHAVDEAQSGTGVDAGWKGVGPPSQKFHARESEVEDPDGEPLEMDEEDPELTRKRRELREIEEQILRKKVAIALKTVEPFVKESPPGTSCPEQSAACQGATLKGRVNVILQQRLNSLSKVRSPKERTKSSSLGGAGLLQEDHPLKLRVKALMKQRRSDPCVLPTHREPPDVTPPLPSRSPTSPAKEENSANQGFQRFLSVLNKGVDMDLLSRIVNDDSEDLPSSEQLLSMPAPAAESQSDPPFRSQSRRSDSGERKTDPPSPERSLHEKLSLPDDDEKKNDGGEDRCFGSSSRSESPSAVKKKEGEEKPKVEEQHEQLQNILKTLGLSLEVEEMSKLADRTQERLYGKKHEGTGADGREEQESRQKVSKRHYRNSSSSSSSSSSSFFTSSSSSSRSTSRSASPSPSRRQRSPSRDSKRRRTSRDGSRDGPTRRDGDQDSEGTQRHEKDSKVTSTYQHPYPQNQTYPHPDPTAFSAFPDYSLSEYSHYNAYDSGTYDAASDSHWTYTQDAIPPSLYPSECPYPQDTYQDFPDSAVARKKGPCHRNLLDINLLVNPDLSKSEGQMGTVSGRRCLQVISTKQATHSCLRQLTKTRKRSKRGRGSLETWRLRRKMKRKRVKQQKMAAKAAEHKASSVKKVEAPQGNEDDPEAEQSEEKKRQPTEEEIKANLRKKLEAFNQKVKQKVPQPANSLTSQTG